ncbi:hypothetical protein [Hymenobacter guriensis]|uniref:hypothetical protein n=1 Tax=Hymenobacter guriensis TaxID=2793065 RepID=UPI001E5CCDFA|nr:hypothetical protein [Hymenobacter guriensis]
MLRALYSDGITLHLLSEDNLTGIFTLFQGHPDSREMQEELFRNYLPRYGQGRRTNFGFCSRLGRSWRACPCSPSTAGRSAPAPPARPFSSTRAAVA